MARVSRGRTKRRIRQLRQEVTELARYCRDSCRSGQNGGAAKIPAAPPFSCDRALFVVAGDLDDRRVGVFVVIVRDIDNLRTKSSPIRRGYPPTGQFLAARRGQEILARCRCPQPGPARPRCPWPTHLPGPHPAPLRPRPDATHPRPFGRKITFIPNGRRYHQPGHVQQFTACARRAGPRSRARCGERRRCAIVRHGRPRGPRLARGGPGRGHRRCAGHRRAAPP